MKITMEEKKEAVKAYVLLDSKMAADKFGNIKWENNGKKYRYKFTKIGVRKEIWSEEIAEWIRVKSYSLTKLYGNLTKIKERSIE